MELRPEVDLPIGIELWEAVRWAYIAESRDCGPIYSLQNRRSNMPKLELLSGVEEVAGEVRRSTGHILHLVQNGFDWLSVCLSK